jgi:hypothetical protein
MRQCTGLCQLHPGLKADAAELATFVQLQQARQHVLHSWRAAVNVVEYHRLLISVL